MAQSNGSTGPKHQQEGETELAVASPDVLQMLQTAEIDQQVVTAKQYPRDLRRFMQESTEMATITEDTAGECMYALPRGGKVIEGPSARFAEIVAYSWGNCQAGARVVEVGRNFVTAQGVFWDLERNVRIVYEVRRRITDKDGRRFNEDMINVTGNAACSIALRNAVLKGVPKPVWNPIYDRARETAIGTQETLSARRQRAFGVLIKMGATEEAVLKYLGRSGVESVTLDDLGRLNGIRTAIKEGEISVENAFGLNEPEAAKPKTSLNDKLAQKAKEATGAGSQEAQPQQPAGTSSGEQPQSDDDDSDEADHESIDSEDAPDEVSAASEVSNDSNLDEAQHSASAGDDNSDETTVSERSDQSIGVSPDEIRAAIANAKTGEEINAVNTLILDNTDAGTDERRELRKALRARASELKDAN